MFGFIFRQSIIKTLTDFKVISILSIIGGGLFVWHIWKWYSGMMERLLDEGQALPTGWDVALLGFAGIALGSFWKAVTHIQEEASKNQQKPDNDNLT